MTTQYDNDAPSDEEVLSELRESIHELNGGDTSEVPPWSTVEETRAYLEREIRALEARL